MSTEKNGLNALNGEGFGLSDLSYTNKMECSNHKELFLDVSLGRGTLHSLSSVQVNTLMDTILRG